MSSETQTPKNKKALIAATLRRHGRLIGALCVVLFLLFIAMPDSSSVEPEEISDRWVNANVENFQWDITSWIMHNEALGDIMRRRKEFLKLIPIERVHEKDMPFERFYKEYVLNAIPVVVTNLNSFKVPWTIEHIKKCGDHQVVPNVQSKSKGKVWSNLEDLPEMSMIEFLDNFKTYPDPKPYLHDFLLTEHCPELLNDYVVPRYCNNDYLTRAVEKGGSNGEHPFETMWPTLFVGGKGTRSGLHVDNSNTHFVIHQIDGKKRFRLLPPEDRVVAYEDRVTGIFATDLFNPDFEKHPMLSLVTVYDITLEAGDFLYIPGGSAHQTHNSDFSVSMSSNYADDSNIERVLREFEDQARHNLVENIRQRIESGEFTTKMDVHDEPWPERYPHLAVNNDDD